MAAGQSGELPQKVLRDASPISKLQSEATYGEQEARGERQPAPDYPVAGKEVQTGTPETLGRYKAATAEGKCRQPRLRAEV